jgi:hypothetical protein
MSYERIICHDTYICVYKETFHGTEPFLRGYQLRSYSRISKHFMEADASGPCLQEDSIVPYPESDQPSPYQLIISL